MKKLNLTVILSVAIITLFLITGPVFGDDALYVAPDGKVGIGTESPAYDLTIYRDDSSANLGIYGTGDNYHYAIIGLKDSSTNYTWYLDHMQNCNHSFQIMYYNGSYYYTPFLITPSGNVGIGTISPNARLTIGNNVATSPINNYGEYQLLLYDSGTAAASYGIGIEGYTMWFNSYSQYKFYRGGSTVDMIIKSGNVGIGTSSPSYGLHVYENNSDRAIYGQNARASTTVNNIGIYGKASGAGKWNFGVWGEATGAGTYNYGILGYAVNATHNYAGYFSGYVYCTYIVAADKFVDYTPFYEGDALSEIAKISGKDGEIDHSTLPDFAHITHEVPVFEETELEEISPEDAFETVMVEQDKIIETTDDNGNIVESKIMKDVKTESKGYKVEDGKIVEIIEEIPVYETEAVATKQLRNDVYFDEKTGKVYEKTGDGQIFEKDGKVYQNNQTGTKVEDQRDIGAMVSVLTVAVQQLDKENEELRQKIAILESK